MVKIAVAGGSGQVGREVIDALVATKKHEITIFTRRTTNNVATPGVTWTIVDYGEKRSLIDALRRVHTILSFIQVIADPGSTTQKNLIDAAIAAGVRRFAPSEWGSASTVGMDWWAEKGTVKAYLKKVNENGKVLEYTLFQPGLFLNYLATPQKTSKYLEPLNTMIDFQNRRAIVVDGHDPIMTYTTVQDLASVVTKAVDLNVEWPIIGGVQGNRLPVSKILEIGEKVRGQPFTIDKVKLEDLEKGVLTASWTLEADHPSASGEEGEEMRKAVLIGTLIGSVRGAWDVSGEMNELLPNFEFTSLEDFVTTAWKDKP